MKLEDITAEIRPRSHWEAVDLGWALAQRSYKQCLGGWIIGVWPIWGLILGLLHNHLFWAMALIWWLKPVFDRVPLFFMSRALFGAKPALKDYLWQWFPMTFRRLPYALTLGRFSPWRPMVLPIGELEGLRGNIYRRRADVLTSRAGAVAWLMQGITILSIHVIWLGALGLVMFMIPPRYQPDLSALIFSGLDFSTIPAYTWWTCCLFYLAALTLMEPFLVGGGFGLYLNARTHIEGWDIELTFRKMALRIAESASVWLIGAVLLFGSFGTTSAEEAKAITPRETIDKVLSHPDFTPNKSKRERFPRPKSKKERDREKRESAARNRRNSNGSRYANGGGWGSIALGTGPVNFMMWTLGIFFVLFLLALIIRAIPRGGKVEKKPEAPKPKVVMGMNVEQKSLPPDIVTVARQLWAEGKHQEAIGLLYRGAISWLVHHGAVPILESDTEHDCLQRTGTVQSGEALSYFTELTRAWVGTAYGGSPPSNQQMDQLFGSWPYQKGAR